jgi:hypothetical protein
MKGTFLLACFTLVVPLTAFAQSPDVILGELVGPRVYARANGIVAITVGTTSCNAGGAVLNWKQLPDNRHPTITLNMYRLLDGRMTQIGQSWAKHGFVALQQNICNFGCQANPAGDGLGVGCSDPYGTSNNQGPFLGSRRLINPATGSFDGMKAMQELNDFQSTSPIDHGLQVKESDLTAAGARYFVEGQYIAADDATAGNGNNNVSHLEVRVTQDGAGNFNFENVNLGSRPTTREVPAIRAWPYAEFAVVDDISADGRLIVAYKVTRLSRTKFRYDYAVYNMNNDRGVRSFSIPTGNLQITNIGFGSGFSHGEPWSNDPWQGVTAEGRLTWSTKTFAQDANANAIRWGTTYNFWFEAEAPPVPADAVIGRFKPGPSPETATAKVSAPKTT